MATKNASGHQGEVKDPEHDGRLKGHKGGEAAKAHAEGSHKDESGHAGTHKADTKAHAKDAGHDAKAEPARGKGSESKASEAKAPEGKGAEGKGADAKASDAKGTDDAELKSREYTDAQGNVHHHTKAYMESHKGA